MQGLLRDFRHAVRGLVSAPGFTLATVTVLALGIGASTAIFSVVEHILFRPLPFPGSARVVTICETHEGTGRYCSVSPPNAADWASHTRTLEALGIARGEGSLLKAGDRSTDIDVGIATPGFFRALGVKPLLGRSLTEADMPPGGAGPVALLTYGTWQTQLGGTADVLGRTILLDDKPYTVIGVLPSGTYIPRLDHVAVWSPLPFDPRDESNRDWRGFVAAARLAPGADVAAAQAELTSLEAGMTEAHPRALRGWGVSVQGMRDFLVQDTRPMLLLFLAAAAVVLLVVCVNVAGLLLVRSTSRERELSIRLALGGSRVAIARGLLVDSVVLGFIGGALGLLIAVWAKALFVHLAPSDVPRIGEVVIDRPVMLFALAVSLLSGIGSGLLPAFRSREVDLLRAMSEGRTFSAGRETGRTRRALVVGQVAMALVLIFAAVALLRSFAGLLDWRPGFPTQHLLTFQVFPSTGRYAQSQEVLALYRRLESELGRLPGVQGVSTMSAGPIFGGDGTTPFVIQGREVPVEEAPSVTWFDVGPEYFHVLGVPLFEGRSLTEQDRAGSVPVAVVNRTMARRYWPGSSPIGANVSLPRLDFRVQIVGVVGDIQPLFRGRPVEPEIYLSNRQRTRWATYFLLRTSGDAHSLAGPVTAALQGADPDLRPAHLRTMREIADSLRGGPRFDLVLVTLFALVALTLGAVGVYGVMAYTVRGRTHEIGIRVALGGRPGQVLRWVLMGGLRMLGWGVLLGLIGALGASRLLAGLLYGVQPVDSISLLVAALLLLLTGLAATLVPALRAGQTDPATALRYD